MKRLVASRRISQIAFLILFIYILWSTTYPLTGILSAEIFFKMDPLLMFATSISQRILLPGLAFAGILLMLTLVLGRFFCGWVCPLGTIIDAVGSAKRLRAPEKEQANKRLRLPKFLILSLIFFAAIFGLQLAWVLDPIVMAARFVSLNLIPAATYFLNGLFIVLIRDLHVSGPVVDLYHGLKASVLGVRPHYFPHSFLILAFVLAICTLALAKRRLWCGMLCPLGAIYALVGRWALLRRTIDECIQCKRCVSACRMGAIREDAGYIKDECILCMDCIYECPVHITKFTFSGSASKAQAVEPEKKTPSAGVTRSQFLLLILSSLCGLGAAAANNKDRIAQGSLIRPPGALKEKDFLDRCVRCGNCMKVCITNGLQPAVLEAGLEGIWTPHLVPEIGYCEYHCTLCGNTCPTGAIPRLTSEVKERTKLGIAEINRSICIPWAHGKTCIVCEEHCPIPHKAIKLERQGIGPLEIARPSVDPTLCIGCGICQTKCPVRPVRAIRVSPKQADRT